MFSNKNRKNLIDNSDIVIDKIQEQDKHHKHKSFRD